MKTYVYLFFCLFSLMGFQACSNDEVDNLSMGAGAAASLVFLLMAEALC